MRSQTKSQVKIIFALISSSELHTLRELTEAADVSLGSASSIVRELKNIGLLEEKGLTRPLNNLDEITDSWAWSFLEKLLPNISSHRFKTRDEKLYMRLRAGDFYHPKLFWSGGLAAAKLEADLLTGDFLGYYEPKSRSTIIRELRLEPDPKGDIELRSKFWNFEWEQQDLGVCPPLLIYADLLNSGNARDEAAAQSIKREFLLR